MDNKTKNKNIVVNYIAALKEAAKNSGMLLENYEKNVDIAVKNMDILQTAEVALLDLNLDECHETVKNFILLSKKVQKNMCSCWFSSNPKKEHPACEVLIKQYFDARKALEKMNTNELD